MDWFAMRKNSTGGSTGTKILGEEFPNLDQCDRVSKIDDLIGLKARDDYGI